MSNPPPTDPMEQQLIQKFRNGTNSDIEIHVENRIFKVIKSLLFVQSSVFRAMFEHDTEERRTNIIKIDGFSAELVEKFLLYFYINKVDDLDEIVAQMFELADYYDVKFLRDNCLEKLNSNVSAEKVFECYETANKYQLDELKQKAVDFLNENINSKTIFEYYEFGKRYNLNDLVNRVVQFIKSNVLDVAKCEEWEKFDVEFKFEVLQDFTTRITPSNCGQFFQKDLGFNIQPFPIRNNQSSVRLSNGQRLPTKIHTYTIRNTGSRGFAFKLQPTIVNERKMSNPDQNPIYNPGYNPIPCEYFNSITSYGYVSRGKSAEIRVEFSKIAGFTVFYQKAKRQNKAEWFNPDSFVYQHFVELERI